MRQAARKIEAFEAIERFEGSGQDAASGPSTDVACAGEAGPARDRWASAGAAARESASDSSQRASKPAAARCGREQRLLDWVESQASVTRIWLDQLIAEGDPQDLVSLIHRQAAWLDLMRARLAES